MMVVCMQSTGNVWEILARRIYGRPDERFRKAICMAWRRSDRVNVIRSTVEQQLYEDVDEDSCTQSQSTDEVVSN